MKTARLCATTALFAACTLALPLLTKAAYAAKPYSVGVYYYPGWSPYVNGPQQADPWAPIKLFPNLQPVLGWYNDSKINIVNQQLEWMHNYGINFIVFDWYWNNGQVQQAAAINAYLNTSNRKLVKFSVLWANTWPNKSLADFDAMVAYNIKNYFGRPEMYTINGQPVVFVFSPDAMHDQAKSWGLTTQQLLQRAQTQARAAGYKGIFFSMGTPALDYWVNGEAPTAKYSTLAAYNYHFGYSGTPQSVTTASHSYAQLDQMYQTNWDWILKHSSLPYIVPTTAGWDRKPWGGSSDPLHDLSEGTAAQFEAHLRAAKTRLDTYPTKTLRTTVICCWNEYGEGSIIEPTNSKGFQFLTRVKSVFGPAD